MNTAIVEVMAESYIQAYDHAALVFDAYFAGFEWIVTASAARVNSWSEGVDVPRLWEVEFTAKMEEAT